MATDKQVRYALYLLDKGGYSTRYMNASYKKFGATMRERSGSVEDWLRSLPVHRVSRLIDDLKE